MLQAEVVVGVWRLFLELVDEPHIAVCCEEELAGDLVHIMLSHDATSYPIFQLLLHLVILVL